MLAWLLCLAPAAVNANAFAELLPRLHGPVTPAPTAPEPRTGAVGFADSPLVARKLEGLSIPLPLQVGGLSLGRLRLIGGVATPAAGAQALASGLAWQAGGEGGPRVGISALTSGVEGAAADGGEWLTRAQLRLPLPGLAPTAALSLDVAEYVDLGAGGAGGGATGLALHLQALGGDWAFGVARADAGYRPLGARVPAGQTRIELRARYAVGDWKLEQRLRLRRLRQKRAGPAVAWRSETTLRRIGWRAWRLDTGFWIAGHTTQARARRFGWRVAGQRAIHIAGFAGSLRPNLALDLRAGAHSDWRLRSGLRLGLARLPQRLSLSLNWVAEGWRKPAPQSSALRVMLRYRVNANTVLPRVAAVFERLLPGR